MSESDREKWDAKYADGEVAAGLSPDDWLVEHASKLNPRRALDLACGLGHNAVWLGKQGWDVDAVDISAVGIASLRKLAKRHHVTRVNGIVADLDDFTPIPQAYNLVIVFRFLDRERLPRDIQSALKPGGYLIYETFLQSQLDRADNHLKNPRFTLEPGELPRLFPELEVLEYRESELSDRTVAQLYAQKHC